MTAVRNIGIAFALFLAVAASLSVQITTALAQPEVTESSVLNGDVLNSAPEVFRLCFSEPVNNQDLADYVPQEEGDRPWQFSVSPPDGRQLGLRIVFEADGDCVDVYPGLPEEPMEGVWTFDWMVRSQETNEQTSDVITFRVGPGDAPVAEDEGDGGSDTALIAIIAVGVVAALAAGAGGAVFAVRRRRDRNSPE